jgi:hypothetical protein
MVERLGVFESSFDVVRRRIRRLRMCLCERHLEIS